MKLAAAPRETKNKNEKRIKSWAFRCTLPWAVRELGMRMSELLLRLKLSQPAVSLSVKRGEKIAKENQYSILDMRKHKYDYIAELLE